MIGRSGKSWPGRFFLPSVSRQLVLKARDFDITLLHATAQDKNANSFARHFSSLSGKPSVLQFGVSTVAVILALILAYGLQYFLPLPNLSLVFLIPVLFAGVRYGLWPSLYTAVLGVCLYNFFFTEPKFTFDVSKSSDLATLLFYLLVAFVTGNMAVRLRNQIEALRTSSRRNAQMHDFSRKLASAVTLEDILQETVLSVAFDLNIKAVILLPEPKDSQKLYIAAHYPPTSCNLSTKDWAAAEWAWKNSRVAGAGSDTLPAAAWYFIPLRGPKGVVAALGVAPAKGWAGEGFFLTPVQRRMLNAFCDQAVLAVERAQMAEDIEENRLFAETEKLRSALLSSISHDLRTPLVSIMGSATSLQDLDENLPAPAKRELVKNILEESIRLNRFIQNLLDMTKLGHGQLKLKREWVEFRDVLGRSLKRLEKELARHRIEIDTDHEFATLHADPVLMEQVLVNILDNAAKYSGPDSTIKIFFGKEKDRAVIRVDDQGAGIPEKDRLLVFDMFYRVRSTDAKVAGTGLGLAICKGLIEAHGGDIRADSNPKGNGAAIVISFPLAMAGGALAQREEAAHG